MMCMCRCLFGDGIVIDTFISMHATPNGFLATFVTLFWKFFYFLFRPPVLFFVAVVVVWSRSYVILARQLCCIAAIFINWNDNYISNFFNLKWKKKYNCFLFWNWLFVDVVDYFAYGLMEGVVIMRGYTYMWFIILHIEYQKNLM